MARIIETTETAFLIEKILGEASSMAVIVSPYLKIHDRLKKILETKFKQENFKLHIITRSSERKETNWMPQAKTFITLLDNLHAKYYFNEVDGIISSLNLYHFSQVNNIELGVHMTKTEEQFEVLVDHYWKHSRFEKTEVLEPVKLARKAHLAKSIDIKALEDAL